MKRIFSVLVFLISLPLLTPALAVPPVFNGDVKSATMPLYNVLYYGAKCDTATDDSAAIQAAINAAEAAVTGGTAKGGSVLIPGICAYGTTLSITTGNIFLVGNGNNFGASGAYSSALKWIGGSGTMVSFVPSLNASCTFCIINGGGAKNLAFVPGSATVGIAITASEGMTFSDISTSAFPEAFIEEYKPTTSNVASNLHNHYDHVSCVDTSGSGACIWAKYGEYEFVTDLYGGFHNGWLLRLGGGPTGTSNETEDYSVVNGVHGINESSGAGGEVEFDCGSYSNEVRHLGGGSVNVARGTATCTGSLNASGIPGQNRILWWDNCDSNGGYPTVETGAGLSSTDDCGNLFMDGPDTWPGHVNGYSFIEFANSDLPSLSAYLCKLCIGKSDTYNLLDIGNNRAAGSYTEFGAYSGRVCNGIAGTTFFMRDAITGDGLCIDGSGNGGLSGSFFPAKLIAGASTAVNGSSSLEAQGAFTDFSGGAGGFGGLLNVFTTSTAAQDQGGEIALGGKTGNGIATYPAGGIKCAKQTAAGDTNYGGYCAFYTTSTSGSFTKRFTVDDAGNVSMNSTTGVFSQTGHLVCGSASGVPCEATVSCTVTSSTTCTSPTVAVPASSVCTATPSDALTGAETWRLTLASTTLTAALTLGTSQSGTASANVHCL
jgi:hypothetical protein